jgi:DNA-binding IclR family transcriptional regulator
MTRSSPGVRRVVAILNFIADHPGQSFTLTDLVRALKLSRATCHGLLTGLVEAGYLYRSSDKSYLLGPALVAMAETAKANFSPLQVTQPEMRALADEYDAVAAAVFLEGPDVIIKDRAASLSHIGTTRPSGVRLPLLAQFAGTFFVWSSPREVDAWLQTLDPAPRKDQRDAMLEGIDFVRENGFGVSIRNTRFEDVPVDKPATWEIIDQMMLPQFTLEPDELYPLGYVQAPVYDSRRKTAFVIALNGFAADYTGAQIAEIGTRVRETCERISTFVSRIPQAA